MSTYFIIYIIAGMVATLVKVSTKEWAERTRRHVFIEGKEHSLLFHGSALLLAIMVAVFIWPFFVTNWLFRYVESR